MSTGSPPISSVPANRVPIPAIWLALSAVVDRSAKSSVTIVSMGEPAANPRICQPVGGAGTELERALHRAGEAAERQPGLLGLGPGCLHRSLVGLGLGGADLGRDGAGAFGLGQLHGDLGQAGEHLDLLQREAAAIGLDVEIGFRALFHRTYHEQIAGVRAMNIALTTRPRVARATAAWIATPLRGSR